MNPLVVTSMVSTIFVPVSAQQSEKFLERSPVLAPLNAQLFFASSSHQRSVHDELGCTQVQQTLQWGGGESTTSGIS